MEIPETPDEPAPTPVPETPVTSEETPETPEVPAEAAECLPQIPQQRAAAHSHAATLPQTGVNRAGVLGLALAGFSFLTAGLGMELSARRGKHCKH